MFAPVAVVQMLRVVVVKKRSQPAARVTTTEFNVAFMLVVQRVTYASQIDILKLLSIVLPAPNNIPSSGRVLTGKYLSYESSTITQ